MALVSLSADTLALVLDVACVTGCRTDAEQKALMAAAERLDKVRDREAVDKARRDGMCEMVNDVWYGELPEASRYERLVMETREAEDGDKPVRPSWERKGKPERARAGL